MENIKAKKIDIVPKYRQCRNCNNGECNNKCKACNHGQFLIGYILTITTINNKKYVFFMDTIK